MSGICGICNFDGEPVDRSLLGRMTAAIAHRGPDRIDHWANKTVGFGHCMLKTTPESLYETQPLLNESGNLCLTMDGRIDNRKDMIALLDSSGVRLRDETDAELVLRAYELLGPQCPAWLLGDFCFAIWDNAQHRLFCARDVSGNKPFVYHWNGRRLLFSSELHALFEDSGTPREPNEGMIAEYLAARITHPEETLYKDILRLPPAHCMIVKMDQATKRRYWDVGSVKEIRYQSDDEYAEHFTEVLKESVACRLRSNHTVGAYLSGGLDSSAIVSTIGLIRGKQEIGNQDFETFSLVYPGLSCDESGYIRAVVERWNIRANCMKPQEPCLDLLRQQTSFYKDICDYPNGTQADPVRALARQKGIRVLLTGDWGDERLGGSLYYLADFVRHGKPFALCREMRKQGIFLVSKHGLSTVAHYVLAPLLPELLRKAIRSARQGLTLGQRQLEWFEDSFAQRTKIHERLRDGLNSGRSIRSSKTWLRMQLEDGGQVHGTEMEDRSCARFGIEQRHPFTDRRMIEFSFGLPENQRLRTNQKFVLRHAMRGVLPESVRQRQDKAEFSETLFRAVRRTTASVGHKPWSERLGWIDGNRLRALRREMEQLHALGDPAYIRGVWPLWMVCAIDLWLGENLHKQHGTETGGKFDVKFASA
jgi:asparagine synthase (glutamine-hydrolysing)